jgi:hypothetical protein
MRSCLPLTLAGLIEEVSRHIKTLTVGKIIKGEFPFVNIFERHVVKIFAGFASCAACPWWKAIRASWNW